MWHCWVDVAYPQLSDWICLQWVLSSIIFSCAIAISWKLKQRQKYLHNNGLLVESEIESFHLVIGRILGNFHFSIVPNGG